MSFKSIAVLALATGFASVSLAQAVSGAGSTTRYWDCCKGSCSWPGKASVSNPVQTCNQKDQPLSDYNAASGCTSPGANSAYMCSDQSPWAVNSTFAYGFAAVHIPGGSESSWCCACYELTFTSTSIAGKTMIVQATNTGADLNQGQFDLAIPGGGVGIYNGCTDEWGAPSQGWGAQYGGISSNTCSAFPSALQPGCSFRFGSFFEGADNPSVNYKQVTCPKELTDKTGCVRSGETPTGGVTSSSPAAAASTSSSSAPASSSYSAPASSSSQATQAPSSSSKPASSPASSASASSSSSQASPVSVSSTSSASKVVSSPYSTSRASSSSSVAAVSGTGSSTSAPKPSGYSASAPPSSSSAPGGDNCEVQYVYKYD